MFAFLKKKNPWEPAARGVYAALLERVRRRGFYESYKVPDSFDGRFDLLVAHIFLVIHRLQGEGAAGRDFSQALFDAAFADMDQTLRERGLGDMGVPKHMRRMMKAFNGRMHAYEEAFENGPAFEEALRRNLYGTVAVAEPAYIKKMADYMREGVKALGGISLTDIAENRMVLPEIE